MTRSCHPASAGAALQPRQPRTDGARRLPGPERPLQAAGAERTARAALRSLPPSLRQHRGPENTAGWAHYGRYLVRTTENKWKGALLELASPSATPSLPLIEVCIPNSFHQAEVLYASGPSTSANIPFPNTQTQVLPNTLYT